VKQSRIKSQFGHARFAPIVLKKSPMNNSEPFPRNNDSIAAGILNHCYITKARLDRKLQAKYALRLFQHNRRRADTITGDALLYLGPRNALVRAKMG